MNISSFVTRPAVLICSVAISITLSVAAVSASSVLITELQYDPIGSDQANEWIELYNTTDATIDLTGWTFTDGEGVVTIPASTSIDSGGYVILNHTTTGGMLTNYPTVSVDLEYGAIDVGSVFLANGGDEFSLANASGTIIDAVSRGGGARFNISASEGTSIRRVSALDTNTAGDWIGNQTPTPGAGTYSVNVPEDDLVLTIRTSNAGTSTASQFTLPTSGGGYNYAIDCNDDGIFEAVAQTGDYTCDYSALGGAGDYTVRIHDQSGTGTGLPRVFFNQTGDAEKLLTIEQRGAGTRSSMESAFAGASNLIINATDLPDLSGASSLEKMFLGASALVGSSGNWNWDTQTITSMDELFAGATLFDADLSGWDVEALTTASGMFEGVTLSRTNYDSLLVGWNAQTLFPGVSFDGGSSTYCLGRDARAAIIDPAVHNWTIEGDGGRDCTGINLAPTDITLSNDEVADGTLTGSTVGQLASVDFDAADTHTYTLVAGAGDEDNGIFTITAGGELQITFDASHASPLDDNSDNVYSIRVQSQDALGDAYEEVLMITVLEPVVIVVPPTPSTGGGKASSIDPSNIAEQDIVTAIDEGEVTPSIEGDEVNEADEAEENIDEAQLAQAYIASLGVYTATELDALDQMAGETILRKDLARIMVAFAQQELNAEVIQSTEGCETYTDINTLSAVDQEAVKLSCRLGIMGVQTDGTVAITEFMPYKPVSRAEFGTVLSRTLRGATYNGTIEAWWSPHLNALKQAGYITHVTGDRPTHTEIGEYIWTVLMRIGEK